MNAIAQHKDYIIQVLPIILATLGGYLISFKNTFAIITGILFIILTAISSIIILKKFDARPDITKARKELNTNVAEVKKLKEDYIIIKSKADEVKQIMILLDINLKRMIQNIHQLEGKINNADLKANIGLVIQGWQEASKIINNE